MKIIFMGTPGFAVPSLKILLDNGYDISLVVSVPDKKKGRGLQIAISDVKKFSKENNLNILQPESLRDENFINEVKSQNPDLIVVVAFRILPKEVFTIPAFGAFNLHASLLPKYRGAAPINWAIIKGEEETGVTTFFLKEKVDTGNIILQEKIKIGIDDNAGKIHDKLSVLGANVVLKTVKLIGEKAVTLSEQNESLSSTAPKIFKKDCLINWNDKCLNIHNFIRGLSPYPTAYTYLENKIIKIYKSHLTNQIISNSPGKLLIQDKKLFAGGSDYCLEILDLQPEGKKKMGALDFINGIKKQRHMVFEDR